MREYILGEWKISEERRKGKKALRRNTYILLIDYKLFEGKAYVLFYFTSYPVFRCYYMLQSLTTPGTWQTLSKYLLSAHLAQALHPNLQVWL